MPSFLAKLNGETMVNMEHENKKTTRRWFHDTAYCFDYSVLSHGTRSEMPYPSSSAGIASLIPFSRLIGYTRYRSAVIAHISNEPSQSEFPT